MKKKMIILGFTALLSACGATKLVTPSETDAKRGSEKFPGLSLGSLNDGKMLFEQNCGKCHGLKDPTKRSEEKWNKIVPRMVAKVNKKAGKEQIDAKGQQLILQYVVTMSAAKTSK